MLTFTGMKTLFRQLTNNPTADDMTKTVMNTEIAEICTKANWRFMLADYTATTVASQQAYKLPNNVQMVSTLKAKWGNSYYVRLRAIQARAQWDEKGLVPYNSDMPEWYYFNGSAVELFPTPASTGNQFVVSYRKKPIELWFEDYTTGTVSAVANGGTTVTGSGTAWVAYMAQNGVIKFDALTGGDGCWYKIASVTNGTTLVLDKPYQGTTIAAGTVSYIVGQASELPEEYQTLPVKKAVHEYFISTQPEHNRGDRWKKEYDDGIEEMKRTYHVPILDLSMLADEETMVNPNNYMYL